MYRHPVIALSLSALCLASCGGNGSGNGISTAERIKADQVGYQVGSAKIAIVPDSTDEDFEITTIDGNIVFKGKTSDAALWDCSNTKVKTADFSNFNTEGIYIIRCKGAADSYPFAIGNGIYGQLSRDALKTYYYARSAMEITSEFGGKYARPAAHPDTAVIIHESAAGPKRKAGDIISSPMGWYDAGDYNKYTVNSAISVWELLHAVELYPEYAKNLKTNIPESGNDIPDIVDELLYNLRWMITMQDPDDGGVYHKLTSLGFSDMVMPHEDLADRYVVGKSITASLDLAATCAKAYRVLQPYQASLPGLRDTLMNVAKSAWEWSMKNPEALFTKNPEGVFTGQYNDDKVRDEFTWAALEMFASTENQDYLKAISQSDFQFSAPSWDSCSIMGIASILNISGISDKMDPELYGFIKSGLLKLAESYLGHYTSSPYKTSLRVFPWGSNSECANEGIVLLTAYRATGDRAYLEAAQGNLHYILGRNPLDYCYVTGFGSNSIRNPHDRRSVADGIQKPVPGLLCGGPFAFAHGDVPDSLYLHTEPAMRYVDDYRSYSTNEIAINWNSALVLLSFAIDNEQSL